MDLLKQISDIGIVPVIKIEDPEKAVPLAKALIKGGLPVAEVTFRTDAAAEAIKLISENCPEMITGAGTVLTVEQAKRAKDSGAKFIVAPGFNPKIVSWCLENGILVIPGISTPSEIEQALEMGLKTVKFFPAEQSGGIAKIKAMAAPYGGVKFMPTGGINLNNLNDYLSFKKIVACGGSFMVKDDFIKNSDWDTIETLTRESVSKMLGFGLGHIGINSESADEALKTGKLLSLLFGVEIERNTEKSLFVTDGFEVMKNMGRGKNGHIAVLTNSVDRAVYHLGKKGIEVDESSATFNADGSRKFIYLKDEIGGFGIHLVERK